MPDFVTVDDINVFVGEVIHCGLANVADDGRGDQVVIHDLHWPGRLQVQRGRPAAWKDDFESGTS